MIVTHRTFGVSQGKAFSASKQAYSSGDGGRAHELSMEGKEHQRKKDDVHCFPKLPFFRLLFGAYST